MYLQLNLSEIQRGKQSGRAGRCTGSASDAGGKAGLLCQHCLRNRARVFVEVNPAALMNSISKIYHKTLLVQILLDGQATTAHIGQGFGDILWARTGSGYKQPLLFGVVIQGKTV